MRYIYVYLNNRTQLQYAEYTIVPSTTNLNLPPLSQFCTEISCLSNKNQADVIQCAPVVNETAGWGINCDLGCILKGQCRYFDQGVQR